MPPEPSHGTPADPGANLFALLREDYRHHWSEFTRPGLQALVAQRLGHWAHEHPQALLTPLLVAVCRLSNRYVRYRFGIALAPEARLGRRLSVGHQGGIAIGPDVTLGDDCVILQGIRIGRVDGEPNDGAGPRIGNRVHVGARAVIRGDIAIGDDAKLGPNAVITSDVPSGATALARPSRVKRRPAEDDTAPVGG
jgi:serine O-acetyltransferase